MKKINIKDFKINIRGENGATKEVNYAIKDSIIEILFNPALRLNGSRLLKQNDLANKVQKAKDELLIEDEEYERIKDAFEKVEGLGKNDVELVSRIMNPEDVEIEIKKTE